LVTVTVAVPLAPKSELGTATVISDALTNVAEVVVPFQLTAELETKFDPETVSVNPLEPAAAVDGEIDWIVGTGFSFDIDDPEPPQEVSNRTDEK
jgi:hypothetical protein